MTERDAEVARLRELLGRLEWGCHGDCPAPGCGGNESLAYSRLMPGGHDPECELAAVLREVQP